MNCDVATARQLRQVRPRSASHARSTATVVAVSGVIRSVHAQAAEGCFIAASVNFPVRHEPEVEVA
jgi:hypothetical protein